MEGLNIKNYLILVDDDVAYRYLDNNFPGHAGARHYKVLVLLHMLILQQCAIHIQPTAAVAFAVIGTQNGPKV